MLHKPQTHANSPTRSTGLGQLQQRTPPLPTTLASVQEDKFDGIMVAQGCEKEQRTTHSETTQRQYPIPPFQFFPFLFCFSCLQLLFSFCDNHLTCRQDVGSLPFLERNLADLRREVAAANALAAIAAKECAHLVDICRSAHEEVCKLAIDNCVFVISIYMQAC